MLQWSARIEPVQKIVNKSPLETLGKNKAGNIRCIMERFNCLMQYALLVWRMPLSRYQDIEVPSKARLKEIPYIEVKHQVLGQMLKETVEGICLGCICA